MKIIASAPATIANLGPGFDVLGLAIQEPRDYVELTIEDSSKPEIIISKIEGIDAEIVSRDVSKNTACVPIKYLMDKYGICKRVIIKIKKGVPVGAGLGSSGATAAAAVFAFIKALNLNIGPEEMIEAAAKGEEAVTGSAHADNVTPSLFGGLCAIISYEPIKFIRIEVPEDLNIIIARPLIPIKREEKTKMARELLPKQVELKKVVKQCSALTALLIGLLTRNFELIKHGISNDVIIEPARSIMIPCFYKVKENILKHGGIGCTISGAGPSIFTFVKPEQCNEIKKIIIETFKECGIENIEIHMTKPSNTGAKIEYLE